MHTLNTVGSFSVCGTGSWGNVCELCGRNRFPTAPRLFRHGAAQKERQVHRRTNHEGPEGE
jgi:hypothetical protein